MIPVKAYEEGAVKHMYMLRYGCAALDIALFLVWLWDGKRRRRAMRQIKKALEEARREGAV